MQLDGRNALSAYALVPTRRENMRRGAVQAHDALGLTLQGMRGTTRVLRGRARVVECRGCRGLADACVGPCVDALRRCRGAVVNGIHFSTSTRVEDCAQSRACSRAEPPTEFLAKLQLVQSRARRSRVSH